MISFAPNIIDCREKIQEILEPVIPNESYNILITEYNLVKFSNIIRETKFTATIRVDVREKELV